MTPLSLLTARRMLAGLCAGAALAAASASAASAETPASLLLYPDGSLVFSGAEVNDWVQLKSQPDASVAGGTAIVIRVKNWVAPYPPAQCPEGGGSGDWVITCPASLVKRMTYTGGLGNDSLSNYTNVPVVAHGGPGIEYFYGGNGNDVLYGDGGDDVLQGYGGNDTLVGGTGHDKYLGGAGTDVVSWTDQYAPVTASLDGIANDGVNGENENVPADVEGLTGGPMGDVLKGNPWNNQLRGGDGPDDLEGSGGDDLLNGQGGNDTLHTGPGADVLYGGTGDDTLSYAGATAPVYVTQDFKADDGPYGEHDNVVNIERLTGGPYNDDLQGTSADDHLDGGGGSDKLDALFGDDVIKGGDGNDHIIGGPGTQDLSKCPNTGCTQFDNDTVDGGPGSDSIDYSGRSEDMTILLDQGKAGGYDEQDALTSIEDAMGGAGDDAVGGSDASNSLNGGPGDDRLYGYHGNDYLAGDAGNDKLVGGDGNDWIVGAEGDDTLWATGGDDTLWGGTGSDTVTYADSPTPVIVHIGQGTGGPTGEWDKVEGDVEKLEGSPFNDQLYGNGGANVLIGGAGDDALVGGGGADLLTGGAGKDHLQSNGDGVKDTDVCGTEADQVTADVFDNVALDCETVLKV